MPLQGHPAFFVPSSIFGNKLPTNFVVLPPGSRAPPPASRPDGPSASGYCQADPCARLRQRDPKRPPGSIDFRSKHELVIIVIREIKSSAVRWVE
jgi:hypothetical protein